MSAPITPLRPTYAIRYDTPAGLRYVIPTEPPERAATYPRVQESITVAGLTADGDEVAVEYTPGAEEHPYTGRYLPGTLLTAHLLAGMVVRWQIPAGKGDWCKRPAPRGEDSLVVERWRGAPETPADIDREHLRADHDSDDCLTCRVLLGIYYRPQLPPVEHEHRVDLPDLAVLPGVPDPDPTVPWVVDDPTLLLVYGRHTAHLWPGTIGGVRKAVVDALLAHPMVAPYVRTPAGHREHYSILGNNPVYLSDYNRRRGDEVIELRIPVPWDTPISHGARDRDRGIAMTHTGTLAIADRLRADTKAAALARLPEFVAEKVASVLPTVGGPVQACSTCAGRGYHRAANGVTA